MQKQKNLIIAITVVACLVMGYIDAVIQPGYWVKSAIKVVLFLVLPVFYSLFDKACELKKLFIPDKRGLVLALAIGVGIYGVILGAYFLLRNVFDFSGLVNSLTATTGVNKGNFVVVALYISFINSLLEEFFFRGFSFLCLKRTAGRGVAYLFSAAAFSLYHICMMIGWFSLPAVGLALVGIFVGGLIFSFFNEKFDNIYLSWMIHMFANFATNTIGFILFQG